MTCALINNTVTTDTILGNATVFSESDDVIQQNQAFQH